MKKLISLFITLSIMLCAHAQGISFGYYTGQEKIVSWGTAKAETYSVAMKVNEASLVGTKLKSLKIPVSPDADKTSEYSAFVTTELKASSGKATGNIANMEFQANEEWVTINLPEPYTITEEPFYVGYTMKVSSCTQLSSDPNSVPVRVIAAVGEGALNIITSRTYRKWTDVSATIGGALAMQIIVEGDALKENAVSVGAVANKTVKRGEGAATVARILNHGINDVKSIDYEYAIAGERVGKHVDVNLSHDFFGVSTDIEIEIPAVDVKGNYEGVLTITKVNGVDNASATASSSNNVRVLNIVPVKRPLMEEFTGTWCGFCPAGFVGMKLMNERHPDMFVCASYHNMDAMQITEQYPVYVDAFPTSYLDRNHFTDPYLGDEDNDMDIDITWQRECMEFTPVNVYVAAVLDQESGKLDVNAKYEFCDDVEGVKYGVAYIITEDGVTGRGQQWRQHNYFSPQYENGAFSDMYHEGMEEFNTGAEYMYLEYDDVVIAQSHTNGQTADDVIGSNVSESTVLEHTFTFNTSDMRSDYGQKVNLVQNPERLHAIALVYDKTAGHVLNCAKCDVVANPSAITSITSTSSNSSATYNLAGQRVTSNHKGLVIHGGKKMLVK